MDIYFSNDVKITKLVSHKKSIYTKYHLTKQKKHSFLGFKFGDDIEVYKCNGYYGQLKTKQDVINYWEGYYEYSIEAINNDSSIIIYLKPHVNINLSNGDKYDKYFDTEEEMQKYIDKTDVSLNKLI